MRYFYTRRNIFFGLIISLFVISFFAWYSYRNMKKVAADTQAVNKTLQSLRAMEAIMDDMQDIETGQRGYIISANKEFLEPYKLGLQKLDKDTNAIRELFSVYPERKEGLIYLLQLIREKVLFANNSIQIVDELGSVAAAQKLQSVRCTEVPDARRHPEEVRQIFIMYKFT